MIGKFAQAILKLLLPEVTQKVTDHLAKIFKLDQVLQYVEMPNDADLKIEKLEAKIQLLTEDSHEPAIDLKEWDDVKNVIKKLKNKKAFKSIG